MALKKPDSIRSSSQVYINNRLPISVHSHRLFQCKYRWCFFYKKAGRADITPIRWHTSRSSKRFSFALDMGAGKGNPLTRESLSDFGLVDAGSSAWFGTRDLGFCCNGKRALAPATEKSESWEKGTPDTRHLRGRGTKALHLLIQ